MLAQFYTPVVGGEEHAVRSLSVELASRGHEVGVATIVQGDSPAVGPDDDGVRVHRLRSASSRLPVLYRADRRHAPPVPDPELLWRLRRLIRSERPRHRACAQLDRAFLPAPPQDERAPLVLSLHDYSLICSTKRLAGYGRRCDGPALRKCIDCASHHYGRAKGTFTVGAVFAMQRPEASLVDLFLPVSNAVAEASRLEQEGLRYRVIPNFVPPGATAAAALDGDHGDVPGLPRLPDGDFVLYIGDLARQGRRRPVAGAATSPTTGAAGRDRTLRGRSPHRRLPPEVRLLEELPHEVVLAVAKRCALLVVPSVWREAAASSPSKA